MSQLRLKNQLLRKSFLSAIFYFMSKKDLRKMPSVDSLLNTKELSKLLSIYPRPIVKDNLRDVLHGKREKLKKNSLTDISTKAITKELEKNLKELFNSSIKKVINCTGTILHTNLGRAIMSKKAVSAMTLAATEFINLEYDLEKGERGERDSHVEGIIKALTGAESAIVVNNNAAAVFLTINSLSNKKDVIVSRGELIEIGGSFRLPDIIKQSSGKLKEVGTTNRTHLKDYAENISKKTGALFKAHTSNYKVVGFTKDVNLKNLVTLAKENNIPFIEDLGSGAFVDLKNYGLKKEPLVRESIDKGVDIVTFSGDKLLGGPQCGIIAGKKLYIDKIRKNPLKRALRVDKVILSALNATLLVYLKDKDLENEIPFLRYLSRDIKEIEKTAQKAKTLLAKKLGKLYKVGVEKTFAEVGSGSMPSEKLVSVSLSVTSDTYKPQEIFRTFKNSKTPIIGRVSKNKFLLDMRLIEKESDILPL